MLILKFDDLKNKTWETLAKVLKFLEVDEKQLPNIDLKIYNESTSMKYSFLKRLNKIKYLRRIVDACFKELTFIKKFTHKKGYSLKIVVDEDIKSYLDSFYKDDLAGLKKDYEIEF